MKTKKKDNSEEINVYEHLEILALHSVSTDKDPSYTYRKICRWFSREFNTSLPLVVKLPVEFVLQNYYESQFESLPPSELSNLMRYHADPEYTEEIETSDDEFLRQIEKEVEEANKAKEVKLKKEQLAKQSYDESKDLDNKVMKFEDLDENNER